MLWRSLKLGVAKKVGRNCVTGHANGAGWDWDLGHGFNDLQGHFSASYLLTDAWQASISFPYSFTVTAKSIKSIRLQGWWAVLCLGKAGWYPQKAESSARSSKKQLFWSCLTVWSILILCQSMLLLLKDLDSSEWKLYICGSKTCLERDQVSGLSALPRQLFSLSPKEIL